MTCVFCELGVVGMSKLGETKLSGKIYEDDYCYAVLELEQSVVGYTLVILKRHRDNAMDITITTDEIIAINKTVGRIGRAIMDVTKAENIYIATLCDGVKHLHYHLVPRYKWSDNDKARYRDLFTERDGEESVNLCTGKGTIGGFWYLADAERNYKNTGFWKLPVDKQYENLAKLAKDIQSHVTY